MSSKKVLPYFSFTEGQLLNLRIPYDFEMKESEPNPKVGDFLIFNNYVVKPCVDSSYFRLVADLHMCIYYPSPLISDRVTPSVKVTPVYEKSETQVSFYVVDGTEASLPASPKLRQPLLQLTDTSVINPSSSFLQPRPKWKSELNYRQMSLLFGTIIFTIVEEA